MSEPFPQPEHYDDTLNLGGDVVEAQGWPTPCVKCRRETWWFSHKFVQPVCCSTCLQTLWDNYERLFGRSAYERTI